MNTNDGEDTVNQSEVTGGAARDDRTERTVSPSRVAATLQDGRVSIEATTRTASLSARTTRHTPLSETEPVAHLSIADGDVVDVEVALKPADVAALRAVLDEVGAAEVFDGP
ncbi:hypothetical protein [Halorubrum tropicale]|uniref:Uncharacterized protein n=1 Tax=Halorubrum tropicale TaxID=1765655 RepID=A0A0N0BPS9_9EURY|nr:hypothetical protein [Halorubrum tropicale]KOX94223.1 hypothetical protein AMR74_16055 [Halorubrum tropicale]